MLKVTFYQTECCLEKVQCQLQLPYLVCSVHGCCTGNPTLQVLFALEVIQQKQLCNVCI